MVERLKLMKFFRQAQGALIACQLPGNQSTPKRKKLLAKADKIIQQGVYLVICHPRQ
jgi:hypothetical protein